MKKIKLSILLSLCTFFIGTSSFSMGAFDPIEKFPLLINFAYSGNFLNMEQLLEECPKEKLFDFISMKNKIGNSVLLYFNEDENLKGLKLLLEACESSIFSMEKKYNFGLEAFDSDDKVRLYILNSYASKLDVKVSIQRDLIQDLFIHLKQAYGFMENIKQKSMIAQTMANLFAYCIYKEDKYHEITENEKKDLDSYLEALLNDDTSIKIPDVIKDYYAVLSKEKISNKTYDDLRSFYYTTPKKLAFDISCKKRRIFRPVVPMQKHLLKNAKKNNFDDVDLIFA